MGVSFFLVNPLKLIYFFVLFLHGMFFELAKGLLNWIRALDQ